MVAISPTMSISASPSNRVFDSGTASIPDLQQERVVVLSPARSIHDTNVGERTEMENSPNGSNGNSGKIAAAHINWNETYSSDEDSQRSQRARGVQRSYSDPSLEDSMPQQQARTPALVGMHQETRRRTRSVSDEDSILCDDESFEARRKKNFCAKGLCSKESFPSTVRSILLCTPLKRLFVVFLLTCYTTFWLPYPSVRPDQEESDGTTSQKSPQKFLAPSGIQNLSYPAIPRKASRPVLLHARASGDLDLTFKPDLDRYYEQEGFASHAWSKYANMSVLGFVLVWAALERRRHGESAAGHTN